MLRAEVWLTTTLIALGVIGGLLYNWPRQKHSLPTDQPAQIVKQPESPQSELEIPAVTNRAIPQDAPNDVLADEDAVPKFGNDYVEQGDNFLLVGNYVSARRCYIKANNQALGQASSLLLIKLGISCEQSGYMEQAEKFYRNAIQFSGDRPNDRLLALSGLARIWESQNRYDESLELLGELFLRYGSGEQIPQEIWMQIAYRLSTVVQKQFLESKTTGYRDLHQTEFFWCEPNIQSMISLENASGESEEQVSSLREAPVQIEILQRPSDDVNLIALDASTPVVPVNRVIDEFAKQTKLRFEMTSKASATLVGRSTKLSITGMSLSLTLDNLLAPLGLMWEQQGDQINLKHVKDAPEQATSFRFQQAMRILRWIELSFPRSLRRDASLLHRGNLSLMTDDFDAAGSRYQELLQLNPAGELAAKLSFNLAKLDLILGRRQKAVERLFYTVDQSLDQHLQAAGYGWIGRTELENGNLRQAIYASSRGLSLATETPIRQDTVMNLAKSYLLESDPFSANKILFDHSGSIVDAKAQRLAAVYGAYARFLGTTESLGLRNEGERMIIALAAIKPDDLDDFVDELLIGRSFFEVGFTSRSTELLQNALSHAVEDGWQRRIAYELGMQSFRAGDKELAAKILAEIAVDLKDTAGINAQLKLAEISLNAREPERCLMLCKQLWQMPLDEDQKNKTLEMMGSAYQRLNRPHAAAVCFAGMVPLDDANSQSQPSALQAPINTSGYTNENGSLK